MCGALSGVQGSWVGARACSGEATCRATYLLGAALHAAAALTKKVYSLCQGNIHMREYPHVESWSQLHRIQGGSNLICTSRYHGIIHNLTARS